MVNEVRNNQAYPRNFFLYIVLSNHTCSFQVAAQYRLRHFHKGLSGSTGTFHLKIVGISLILITPHVLGQHW